MSGVTMVRTEWRLHRDFLVCAIAEAQRMHTPLGIALDTLVDFISAYCAGGEL